MRITIISVGQKPNPENAHALQDYTQRLPSNTIVHWVYIPHAHGNPDISKLKESENILKSVPKKSHLILLDETGSSLDSIKFSSLVFGNSRDKTFVIGGAYGVSEDLKEKADVVLSLSKLVFPHQLVRIILAEQIYRAHAIATNHPYHHS